MKHWHGDSGDPNATDDRTQRGRLLRVARRPSYLLDRAEYLCQLARGRKVLDCGMVEHTLDATSSPDWLHGRLRAVAGEILGVDILEPEIAALRDRGFNVRTLDVTREALPEQFDLIV